MTDWQIAFWTILAGVLCNVSCALLGSYLVLRRLSLLGDAISHAVLPGIVLAFLLRGRIEPLSLFLGALVFGVLTAFLAQTLQTFGRINEDASLGVVFTSLFALGVLLLTAFVKVDLDVQCVFAGVLDTVALATVPFGGIE